MFRLARQCGDLLLAALLLSNVPGNLRCAALTEASSSDTNRIKPRSCVMLRCPAEVHVTAAASEWRWH